MTLPRHFLVSETDGALYDTRADGWHALPPLRRNYRRHTREIATTADVKANLRAGASTDWGGIPLYFVTDDGAALSFESVRAELRMVLESVWHGTRDGWRVVAIAANEDDSTLTCDHSGGPIPAAYGDE